MLRSHGIYFSPKKCNSFLACAMCVVTKSVTLGSCPEPWLVPNALTRAAVCPFFVYFGLFFLQMLARACVGGCTVTERRIQPLIAWAERPRGDQCQNPQQPVLKKKWACRGYVAFPANRVAALNPGSCGFGSTCFPLQLQENRRTEGHKLSGLFPGLFFH